MTQETKIDKTEETHLHCWLSPILISVCSLMTIGILSSAECSTVSNLDSVGAICFLLIFSYLVFLALIAGLRFQEAGKLASRCWKTFLTCSFFGIIWLEIVKHVYPAANIRTLSVGVLVCLNSILSTAASHSYVKNKAKHFGSFFCVVCFLICNIICALSLQTVYKAALALGN